MSMKQAAEELLKIADQIEEQADAVTQFVCDKCNHTATLAKINEKRKMAASESDENVTVTNVTVNDQVACPACDGIMTYAATEESEKFYINDKEAEAEVTPKEIAEEEGETPKQQALEEQGKKLHKEPHKKSSEPIDYDSLKRYQAS